MLGWYFFEMENVELIELIPEVLVGDSSHIVREDKVGTFETDIFHDFQKLFKKLIWFYLSFVHFSSSSVELR